MARGKILNPSGKKSGKIFDFSSSPLTFVGARRRGIYRRRFYFRMQIVFNWLNVVILSYADGLQPAGWRHTFVCR